MDHNVELVAQAFYEADQEVGLWDNEPADCKEQFREFARNVINLVNEDIGVPQSARSERKGLSSQLYSG